VSTAAQPEVFEAGVAEPGTGRAPRQWVQTLRRAGRLTRTRIGLSIIVLIVLIAIVGPFVAPHSPTELVGGAFAAPGGEAGRGTDTLGRGVLRRWLWGGRTVIVLALLSTIVGVGAGLIIGLIAAYTRGVIDDLLMRANDVVLAFPQIILVLLLVTALGPKLWLIVLTVAAGHAPRTARVVRGAALEVVERDFVKAAEAMGERRWRIVLAEMLPNVSSPALVEFGLRLTYSIGLVAGVSFLGFGLQPPSADWGLMINENRLGIVQQPWAVLLPVAAIGLLTVGTNLCTDGIARAAIGIDRKESA
jgi:peptide/nickel transport system permease protein